MPFAVGENVGPYRIIEQVGQGGMATVFKAYHALLDRYVAIKARHPALTRARHALVEGERKLPVNFYKDLQMVEPPHLSGFASLLRNSCGRCRRMVKM